jgi:hypothetical protein
MAARVSDVIICWPAQKQDYAKLGATLRGITDLQSSDLDTVVEWIEAGGLSFWTVKPRFDHVAKHFGNWLATAREWKAGRVSAGGAPVSDGHSEWKDLR